MQQTHAIVALGRENAKLRDQLQTRPTRRQLMTAELEVESLRQQLAKRKAKRQAQRPSAADTRTGIPKTAAPDTVEQHAAAQSDVHVLEPLASETLTERIRVDKLLRWLRVETKAVRAPPSADPQPPQAPSPAKARSAMHRAFLDDPSLRCYLVLDPAALAAQGGERTQAKRALERRVGLLCSEIVATCCHVLDVSDVSALPRAVQAASRHASLAPLFQRFLRKLEAALSALQDSSSACDAQKRSAFELPIAPSRTRAARRDLEQLLSMVDDVAVELTARRKHMLQSPSASTALDTLLALMTLVQAKRTDELEPTVARLIEGSRREARFVLELRELVGLERSATRDDLKRTIAAFMKRLGLGPAPRVAQERHERAARAS